MHPSNQIHRTVGGPAWAEFVHSSDANKFIAPSINKRLRKTVIWDSGGIDSFFNGNREPGKSVLRARKGHDTTRGGGDDGRCARSANLQRYPSCSVRPLQQHPSTPGKQPMKDRERPPPRRRSCWPLSLLLLASRQCEKIATDFLLKIWSLSRSERDIPSSMCLRNFSTCSHECFCV